MIFLIPASWSHQGCHLNVGLSDHNFLSQTLISPQLRDESLVGRTYLILILKTMLPLLSGQFIISGFWFSLQSEPMPHISSCQLCFIHILLRKDLLTHIALEQGWNKRKTSKVAKAMKSEILTYSAKSITGCKSVCFVVWLDGFSFVSRVKAICWETIFYLLVELDTIPSSADHQECRYPALDDTEMIICL